MLYMMGNPKNDGKITLRVIRSVDHLTYVVKGPGGTRFYSALQDGRNSRECAIRDYIASYKNNRK